MTKRIEALHKRWFAMHFEARPDPYHGFVAVSKSGRYSSMTTNRRRWRLVESVIREH